MGHVSKRTLSHNKKYNLQHQVYIIHNILLIIYNNQILYIKT